MLNCSNDHAALVERAERAEARLAQSEIGSRQRAIERERAIEQRDALLEVLRLILRWEEDELALSEDLIQRARAAIAKATLPLLPGGAIPKE